MRLVLAVSAAHLLLLPAYVKLGAINPWQAVGSLFGDGFLWTITMISAAIAPFVLGSVAWIIDSILRKLSSPLITRIRESAFIGLALVSLLSLVNALLLADRTVEQNFRVSIVTFVSAHLFAVATIAILVAIVLIAISFSVTKVREGSIRVLRPILYILAPSALISIFGVFYILAVASPAERSDDFFSEAPRQSLPNGVPRTVVVLLFDGFSYDVALKDGEVAEGLPNLSSLVDSSLVFHNARSYSTYTIDNVPTLLTGRLYGDITLDSQGREVAKLEDGTSAIIQDQWNIFDVAKGQNYDVAAFGYFLRYCSSYVQDNGYCQSSSADEFNPQPGNFPQALLEVYRLAAAKTLPTSVGYRIESIVGTTFLSLVEERVSGLQDSVLDILDDSEGRFIYAHYPIPHIPYLRIDPETGDINAAGATYFNSLQAVDFLLGEIRQMLEDSGSWEDTMLIFLSDHNDPAATSDPRVPVIIKLPNMDKRIDFDGPWRHAQFLPFLEELFRGPSFDPEEVAEIAQKLSTIYSNRGSN